MLRKLLFASCAAVALGNAAAAKVLPIDYFFRKPAMSAARLSDDGQRLAMLVGHEKGRMSLATLEIDSGKASLVVVPGDYDIDFAIWKDDRILFGGDAGGNESYSLRSIQPDGKGWRDLSESYLQFRPFEGLIGADIASVTRHDEDWIATVGIGTRVQGAGAIVPSGSFGYYRLNVKTGKRLLVELLEDKAVQYYSDPVSGVPYARLIQDGEETVLQLRADRREPFRDLKRFPGGNESWQPLGTTPDGKRCLIYARGAGAPDRGALLEYDLATAERTAVAFVPERGEVTSVVRNRRGAIWGVRCDADRPYYIWFDPTIGRRYASWQATLPGRVVEVVDTSMDANRILVFAHNDRDPGEYYVWDERKQQLLAVGKMHPQIDPVLMAEREPISYRARDGLQIHGYLTRPRAAKGQPVPLILLPHGGPFGIRDSWNFDAEAQFLANRGYAVLQPNFRGSGGYGWSFQSAGQREWGRKMQDDLTDAVHWAIEQKITNAGQVAIMGASYGGYATLAGLVFTPELFRCGINYVGVSDLRFIAKSTRPRGRAFYFFARNWVGEDAEELRERSPVNFVERIRVPTFHAYGDNDPRVDIQHWRVLEAELKRLGKPYEYLREEDAGHGFEAESASFRYYRAVEAFLAKHLPPARL